MQLFKLNNTNKKLLPFFAVNNIQATKIENLNDYIQKNRLMLEDFLFVGYVPTLLTNSLLNINYSEALTQAPDAIWLGKLSLYIINNNVNYEQSKIAFNEFKPIYVRPAEIN